MKCMRCGKRLDRGQVLGLSCSWTVRTVKVFGYRLVLALQVSCAALVASCGTESIPLCSDVDWVGRYDHAQLTGPPIFSAQQIAAGDPLSIAVPVDVNTRSVRVNIEAIDGSVPGARGSAETEGGEIVDIGVNNTDLAPGAYLARILVLDGESNSLEQVGHYDTHDAETPYVLSVSTAPEELDTCVTAIAAPTFTVVASSLDR